jgi:phosphatidate cytidylyltransferase
MTGTRVVTAVVLVPLVVGTLWWGPTGLVAAVVAGVTLLALWEFFALGEKAGLRGYPRWTMACALWLVYEQWAAGTVTQWTLSNLSLTRASETLALPLDVVLLGFMLGAATLAVVGRRPLAELVGAVSVSAAALVFVALPLSYLVRIHGIDRRGRELLLFTLVLIWVGDSLAYFVGRAIGRLPMAPTISPKKTWEGAAGNVVGSLAAAAAFAWWMKIDAKQLLILAVLANGAGQMGDLVESAYKRGAGMKDSGTLLPGHGGVLDRIDSLIFAAPAVWCYFWFVLGGRL